MDQKSLLESFAKINENSKVELDRLLKGKNIDDLIVDLIQENNLLKIELQNIKKELDICKEKTLDALRIGDAISDGIYIVDKEGIIIAVNKVFTTLTSVKENEVIGKHVSYLVENKYFDKAVCTRTLKSKKAVSDMCIMMRTNKKVLATSNPYFNEHGEITQILTVMRDITELIKLKEKLERSETLTKIYYNELEYYRRLQTEKMGLIGDSPAIKQIKELICQISKTDATVLITGETGVGKEVVANEIHKNSSRCKGPFIKINCAAIPENLLESELFGYEKGAFTGALNRDKIGLFEMADKGTIFLDEIAEMPLRLQAKLLRVLQEKEIIRVGGTRPIKLDVRVIAATNRNLEDMVNAGTFREDLYYRLNVIPIKVPPLRARKEDIAKLAVYFLDKFNEKYGTNKFIDISALNLLEEHDWPGNVRELENTIERLVVIVNDDLITEQHIKNLNLLNKNKTASSLINLKNNISLKEAIKLLEKQIIEEALKKYGSTHKAARALGISQPTLLRKARMLSIATRR